MRNVTPWLVRRKPGDKRKFEVVSFAMKTGEAAVAKRIQRYRACTAICRKGKFENWEERDCC